MNEHEQRRANWRAVEPELAKPAQRVRVLRSCARELADIATVLRAAGAAGEADRCRTLVEAVDVVADQVAATAEGVKP